MKNHWLKDVEKHHIYFDSLLGDTLKEKFEGIWKEMFHDCLSAVTRVEGGRYLAAFMDMRAYHYPYQDWEDGKRRLDTHLIDKGGIWFNPAFPDNKIKVWHDSGWRRYLYLDGFEVMFC